MIFWKLIIFFYFNCENCQGVSILKELQGSYLAAYPKRQYLSPNFTKGIQNVNVEKFDSIWHRCQEISVFSAEQFQRHKEYYGQDFVLNATIQNMLHKPRGRFYSGNNYEAKFEEFHIDLAGPGGCYNLKEPRPLKLMLIWGKCIRVFKYRNCFGWSLGIFPGSKLPNKSLEHIKFMEIKSIGPCFPDEFSSSSLKMDRDEVVKNPQYKNHCPDLLELSHDSNTFKNFILKNNGYGTSIALYLLNRKNRIISVYAAIGSENIDNEKANKTWRSNEKNFHFNETEEGDVLCYIVQPKFGGPTNQSWNVFPGGKSIAEHWGNVSSNFPAPTVYLEALEIFFNFIYEDEDNGTRPLFFYYYARANGFMSYGRVLNSHETNLRTPQIFERNNSQTVKHEKGFDFGFEWCPPPTIHVRLAKLLQSEEIGPDRNATIRNFNSEENQVWKCSGRRQRYLSHFQENYLGNDTETISKAQFEALSSMVTNPTARFYSNSNYTGDFESYTLHYSLSFCYSLKTVPNRVNSIATFGSCIRIFQGEECTLWSFPIYPDYNKSSSYSQFLLEADFTTAKSVGPCLLGETSQFYFTPNDNLVSKNIFPQFIAFFHALKSSIAINVSHGSIELVTLGPQNRTDYISASIEPENYLDLANFHEEDFPICFRNQDDQGFCYAVPPILNGPTNQSYNIFEASDYAMEDWTAFISDFHVKKNRNTFLSLSFEYESDNSTTPLWIFYYGYHRRRGFFYGQVFNGERDEFTNYPRGFWHLHSPSDEYIKVSLLRTQH